MTKSPSDGTYIDAGANELRCREVPEIVQTDVVQSE